MRTILERLLELPAVYRMWQATHNREKIDFVASRIRPRPGLRVLELGCGPAINAHLFDGCAYTGIDMNPNYIAYARRQFPQQRFICEDLCRYDFGNEEYDWVLINSFLHHVDDRAVDAILRVVAGIRAARALVVELVLPAQPGVAWLLARLDRGRFARTLEEWRRLIPPELRAAEEVDIKIRRARVLLYNLVGYVLERRAV